MSYKNLQNSKFIEDIQSENFSSCEAEYCDAVSGLLKHANLNNIMQSQLYHYQHKQYIALLMMDSGSRGINRESLGDILANQF